MKKLNIFLVIAFICCAFIGVTPRAFAAFAEQPATLVVFDRSGNVTQSVYRSWREPVRWAYHFPDFKMVDNATAKAVAAEKIFTPKGKVKIDADVMQSIAEEAQLEALVLVMVDDLDSWIRTWLTVSLVSAMILTILTLKLSPTRIFMCTGMTATASAKRKFTNVM